MKNYSEKDILDFLVKLFDADNNLEFEQNMLDNEHFYEKLVKIGSKNLLLPKIYNAFINKKLEYYLPNELQNYLLEIYNLNSERNLLILKQIKFLSQIFNKYKINHVFLKGAALLIVKPYDTMNERMVGDIDLLVSVNDISKAKNILISEGFSELIDDEIIYSEINNRRHLNRLISSKYIAAVEIHKEVLNHPYSKLLPAFEILKNKKKLNNFYVPLKIHLWKHAILNWQYNDHGQSNNYLSFRSLVDVLSLEPKKINEKIYDYHKSIVNFYNLVSVYYNDYPSINFFKKSLYKAKVKFKIYFYLDRFFTKLFSISSLIISRTIYLLISKGYRKKILNRPNLIQKKLRNFLKK